MSIGNLMPVSQTTQTTTTTESTTGKRKGLFLALLLVLVASTIMLIGTGVNKVRHADPNTPTPTPAAKAINIANALHSVAGMAQAQPVDGPEPSLVKQAKPKGPPVDHDPPSKRGWWLVNMYFQIGDLKCLFNGKTERLSQCGQMPAEWHEYVSARNQWAVVDEEMQRQLKQQETQSDQ